MGAKLEQFFEYVDDFEHKNKKIPYLYALLGHLLIFSTWGLFKMLNAEGFSSSQVLYVRGLIAFILNWMVISATRQQMYPANQSAQKTLIARFLIQMASPLLQFYGISQLNVSDATVLGMTNPIWVQIFCWILYKEKISRPHQLYTFISFLGIICICRPQFIFSSFDGESEEKVQSSSNHFIGCLSMLGGAALLAASQSLFKGLQGKTSNSVAMQYFYLSNLVITPFGLMNSESFDCRMYTEPKFLAITLLIALLAFFGQNFQSRALLMESPSKLSPLSYTRVLYSFLVDIFIFKVEILPLSLIGLSLLLFSLINIVKSSK